MNRFFSFLICVLVVTHSLKAQQSSISNIALHEKQFYTQAGIRAKAVLPNNYDLKYCRMFWVVDPAVKYISGNVTYSFYHADSLSQFKLELSDSLNVDSILMGAASVNYIHSSAILTITFNQFLAAGQLDSLCVYYRGVPPETGHGSFAAETHGINNTPVLWTLSEPYGAKDWWPCKQDLNDKIDSIDIYVKAPQVYKVGSNGVLVSEVVSGSDKITYWKHRYPIASYLVAIAVTDYTVFVNQVPLNNGSLEVVNYVYSESIPEAQFGVNEMIDHLIYFDSLFIPYPFMNEKYGHAQFNWEGGMEHQTMSFVGNFSYELLAHELAHQWFGDYITCGSWQDLWLNEGFATYATGLCYERFSPNLYWKIWIENQVNFITSSPDGAVFVADTMNIARLFDARLTYSKGAMLLHMLRWKLGNDNFYTALRNYQNNILLSNNYARNIDLKNELEMQSGVNLDEFFNDWYWGEGYPSYQLSYDQNNSNLVNFTLLQTQSHSSVSFFEMPVPIVFKNSNSDTTIVFDHFFSGQQFTAQLGFKVDSVLIDPTHWLVCNQNVVASVSQLSTTLPKVQLYPNPAKQFITIQIPSKLKLDLKAIQLTTIDGKKINPKFNLVDITSTSLNMDISYLEAGTYTLSITTSENQFNTKFIKQP